MFQAAFQLLAAGSRPILDVGCGVGLLGFYLRARGCQRTVMGIDRDARKIQRAHELAAASDSHDLTFQVADARTTATNFCGDVVIFDVLHYLPRADQQDLLRRLAACVEPGGMLIIRDAPRDRCPRFWLTFLAEIFAQTIAWNVKAPLHFPSRAELGEPFPPKEFSSEARPLWGRTPFNNHLFIFRRRESVTAPPTG